MLKLLVFFGLVLALAFGLAQVAETPGHVLVQWGETEYRVGLLTAMLALVGLTITAMILWSALRLILRLPSLIGLANRMRRREKGQIAVARGLVAVGTGDQRLALRHAGEAERLLGPEPLSLLLKAQSAQLAGDEKGAQTAFKSMLDRPDTRALGLRGLFIEAERRGDAEGARALAEEAYKTAPAALWASQAILRQRTAAGDWRAAIAVVEQGISRRLIEREEGRMQRAVLLAAAARSSLESNPDEALALAQESLRLKPDLVPAAQIVAQRLSARGDYGKATKLLEQAWKTSPHPDLAEAYLGVRPGDSALDRLKRARALEKLNPSARESRLALARAALDAREFRTAREALEALVLQKATARACLLMAELEDLESGNQGMVRSWLARASRAPRDPAWVADGTVSDEWKPMAPISGMIGGYQWQEPPQAQEVSLRARIDFDRFEPAGLQALPPAEEATPASSPEIAPAEPKPEVAAPIEEVIRPFIPDDPGPDPAKPPRRSRFRFFG